MKIAIAQLDVLPGDPSQNWPSWRTWARAAAEAKCHLLVLPELADVGYDLAQVGRWATAWPGPSLDRVIELAQAHGIAIVAGLAERVGMNVFNSLAVVSASGELVARYRKIHLIAKEPEVFVAGDTPVVASVAGAACGLLTCYDIRFPELARTLVSRGAQILVIPAAFPKTRIEQWRILATARAVENQVFVAAANRIGEDAGCILGGASAIVGPTGDLLAEGGGDTSALLAATLDLAELDVVRQALPVWRDRRTSLYRQWDTPPPSSDSEG